MHVGVKRAGALPDIVAVYPTVAEAPLASDPFQLSLVTVTTAPACDHWPPHRLPTCSPLGNLHVSVHPDFAEPESFFTTTLPWYPPGHAFDDDHVAVHPPVGPPVVGPSVGVWLGVGLGLEVGVAEPVGVTLGEPVGPGS